MHFSTSLLSTSAVLLIAAHSALAFDDLRMLCAVNRIRTEHGLPCLGYSSRLTHAAQGHCEYQAKRRQMTHNGSHGSDPAQRITDSGYNWQSVAENVAYGYQDQSECLDEWMQSPGHRANILSEDATHLGSAVGYSSDGTPYYTQDFGGDGHRHDFPECPSSYDDEDNGYSGGNDDYSSGRDRDSGYSDNDDSYGSGRGGDDYTWSPDNYGSGRGEDYSSGRGNDDYGSGNGYGSNNGFAPSSNGRDYYGSGYGSAPSSNGRDSYGSGNGYGSNNGYAPSSNGRDYYGSGRGGYGPSSNGRDNYGSGRGGYAPSSNGRDNYGSGRGDYGSGNHRDTSRGRRPRSYGDVDDYNTGKDYGRGRSPSRASGRGYGGDRDRHGRRGGRDRSCSTDRRSGRGGDRDGHRRRGGY